MVSADTTRAALRTRPSPFRKDQMVSYTGIHNNLHTHPQPSPLGQVLKAPLVLGFILLQVVFLIVGRSDSRGLISKKIPSNCQQEKNCQLSKFKLVTSIVTEVHVQL